MTGVTASRRRLPSVESWWLRLGLAIFAGALMTGGHPPVQLPWLLFLAVPALVWLVATVPDARAAAWVGWGAGFGYFVTGLHWIGHAFLVEPEQFAVLLPFGVIAFPAGLGLFWALGFWTARRLWPGDMVRGALVLAAAWTAVEAARSYGLTGFPWALPGYVWVDTPPMQASAWIGPFGMTLATLALTALPLTALAERCPVAAALAVAAGAALWAAGGARVPDTTAYADDAPVLRIVQPNAPQHLKWLPGHREAFYRRTLEITARPPDLALGPPDIVVWPETAIHFVLAANPEEASRIAEAAGGATVILGALHGEATPAGERWSNALVTVLPGGRIGPRYDKHHLVPFGEYVPLQPVFGAIGIEQLARRGGFTPGPGPVTMAVAGVPEFAPLICYEAIFPWNVAPDERPDWLVQLTNDAWFGNFAGPQQHYAQARIRAVEQGLPMVRAANTGISAIVDSHGREIASLRLGVDGKIDGRLPAPLPPTLYSRIGNSPALFLVVLILLTAIFWRKTATND